MYYRHHKLEDKDLYKLKDKDLYIIGNARHGKDTAAEILAALHGLKFCSSSEFMNERVVFEALAPKYGYKTVQECFDDRHDKRAEWFEIISAKNPNGTELSKLLFAEYDIYVGLRNKREMDAVDKDPSINNLTVWIDASKRKPQESAKSMTVPISSAHIIVENNEGEYQLLKNLIRMWKVPLIGYLRLPKLVARSAWRDWRRNPKAMDSLEVTVNMVGGAVINCILTFLIFGITITQALWVTALFFVVSWGRSFSVRRVFRWLSN